MSIIGVIGNSLFAAAGMFWNMFWALVLGFALSGVVTSFVSKKKTARLLGKPGFKELGLALFFGASSSSCSYAAASMTRSLFRKGAHIIPALAFMLASTNLVIELSSVLWVMMGWQFVVAELMGGIVLVLIMAALMQLFGPLEAFALKQKELNIGLVDSDDEVGPKEHWRNTAKTFMAEWQMLWKDILLGVVISGFLMVLVPDHLWQSIFLQSTSAGSEQFSFIQSFENGLVGPLISVLSFVCSVGNIPLASVLYHGGITFGGAISFIYADLIIIPLILIYRRYYGTKLALWITGIFYVSMAATGIVIDLLFHSLNWIPPRHVMGKMTEMHFFEMNYTFWLNVIFFGVAVVLVWIAKSSPIEKESSCCHEN